MLTGHGRRLPGWPKDWAWHGQRTPTPFFGSRSVQPPRCLAFGKERGKPSCASACTTQTREPRGHFQGRRAAPRGRLWGVANELLGGRLRPGAPSGWLGKTRAGCVEQVGGHDLVGRPISFKAAALKVSAVRK